MPGLIPTRRTLLQAAAVLPLASLAAACGQESGPGSANVAASKIPPTTIRFAYSAEQNEIVHFDKIVEIAKQKVPQVAVTSEVYGAGTAAIYA